MTTTVVPETAPFFVTGGTLRHDAPSYVVRQADEDLFNALTRGEFCYVLDARQMGKSSLMNRAAERLRAGGAIVAVLDLSAVGQNLSPEQWYDGLLAQLAEQLRLEDELEDFWFGQPKLGPLQRWMAAIRQVALPRLGERLLVLFVDEIDATRSLPFSADEFFAAIRECYNRRTQDPEFARLTFCLIGNATPADLIRDVRTTPFNIGRRVELTDFSPAEAAPLARGLSRDESTGKRLLERALYWTGGHPYLTQRLCHAVAQDASATTAADVDRLCTELFLTHKARETDDNFAFVRNRLLRSEVDIAGLLELYREVWRGRRRVPDDETNPLVSALKLSGIVRVEKGLLRVRNRVYARVFDATWVQANLPDAEVRRQRAAFRRGVLRATAVAGVVLAAMGLLAGLAVQQARRADREQRNTRRLLYASDMSVAQQAVEVNMPARASSLLAAHVPREPGEEDLRTWEWRHLAYRLRDQSLATFPAKDMVFRAAFSPDGNLLAVSGNDGLRIRDARSGREVTHLDHKKVAIAAFSPNGRMLASRGLVGDVLLWDMPGGRQVGRLSVPGASDSARHGLSFSPNGRLLAMRAEQQRLAGGADPEVVIFEVASRRPVGRIPGAAFPRFLARGRLLVSVTRDKERFIEVWDGTGSQMVKRYPIGRHFLSSLAVSPDGRTLALGFDGTNDLAVELRDMRSWRRRTVLAGHTDTVMDLAFSPDGRTLASAGDDGTLRLWEVAAGRERVTLRGHGMTLFSAAFSPDGCTVATTGMDKMIKLWDAAARNDVESLPEQTFVKVSPDGRILATAEFKEKGPVIRLWEAGTLKPLAILPNPEQTGAVPGAFSPDSRLLFTREVGPRAQRFRWWDVATRRPLGATPFFEESLRGPAISPDGRLLAMRHRDSGTVTVCSVPTGHRVARLNGYGSQDSEQSLAFFPDGRTLAVAGEDRTVRLWDTKTWTQRDSIRGFQDIVGDLTFSPDGRRLVVADWYGYINVWENGKWGKPLASFPAHNHQPFMPAFSPDGNTLATGDFHGAVKLWNTRTWRPTLTLQLDNRDRVNNIAFSFDGQKLYASTSTGVHIWRAVSDTGKNPDAGGAIRAEPQ